METLVDTTSAAPPAVAVGPVLSIPPGAPPTLADVLRRASEEAAPGRVVRVGRNGREVELCYAGVRSRAESILRGLRANGTRPGDEVILQMEAVEEFLPAFWACVLGGFTAVPVGVAGAGDGSGHAAGRLRGAWTTLGGPLVLTGTGLAEPVRAALGGAARVAAVAELAGYAPDPAWHPGRPEAIALILLSSGTTGRPKLIKRSHHNLLRDCQGTVARMGAGGRGVTFLNWLPLDHNAALTASLTMLAAGAVQVHLGTLDVLRDPGHWLDAVHHHRVSHTGATNYSLGLISDYLGTDGERSWDFSCVESIILTAEPVVARTVRAFLERMSRHGLRRETLRAAYGMSEVGAITRLAELRLDESADGGGFVPVGTPYPGISLRLVDAQGRVVTEGCEGRIQVRGETVTPGYACDPELTRDSFTADGWFDTGDSGVLSAGSLTITGRRDDVLIVNGLNVHAQEMEAAVEEVEGVEHGCAAVCAVRVPGRDTDAAAVFLHSTLAGAEERDALRREVRRVVALRFGATAAHVLLVRREEIPRTSLGKIRRAALRRRLDAGGFATAAEEDADTGRGEGREPPRTDLERELCAVWAQELGLDRVGVRDDFLGLGGHSLLAARVAARVRALSGVDVPLRTLFEHTTVAGLAAAVESLRRQGAPAGAPPRAGAPPEGPFPLSFAQQRLWFVDRLQPGSSAYNLSRALRLRGPLDVAALERALGEVVRRHDALRTVFFAREGGPVQVVAPFAGLVLPVEDLSALAGEAGEAVAARRVREVAAAPYDLAAGPLFRARLLRRGGEEHVLVLGMHHVVGDGWSIGVLFREMEALYAAFRSGRPSPLPPLRVRFADHAARERDELTDRALAGRLAYWKEALEGAPTMLELPADRARPAVQSQRGAVCRFALPPELSGRLAALGRAEGATLFMTLLAAFQLLLAKYSGQEDVVVGTPVAGRTRPELEGLIGLFVNTLALRTDLSGDPTFRQLLGRVREAALGAYAHQEVPFEKLVDELRPERSLAHSPLFQVMLALQNAGGAPPSLPGVETRLLGTDGGSALFDLTLNVAEGDGGLRAVLEYATDLFDAATAERMAGHLRVLLEGIAAAPEARLSELELLGEEERHRVVEGWNRTGVRRPPGRFAHHLFAEQARRTPDAVALLHGRATVGYGALDRRAGILARRLRELGVGPEVRVGVCMERSPELLVAVLGIWKAGGAYVPLDPRYPAERLGWIVRDAALPVVVTGGSAAGALPEHRATIVHLAPAPEEAPGAAPEDVPLCASGLAYAIYTSGSTGRPKGVLVQHGSLANLLAAAREAFGVGEGDVVPVLASHAFDIWLFEALLPLTSGAAVRLVDPERVLDVRALLEEAADATLLHAVPALMREIAREARASAGTLPRLRRAWVGGDRVPADLLAEMRAAFPGAGIHVLYGPTEGTILASAHPVSRDGAVEGQPIGRPLDNVRLYVCGPAGGPQPVGVPGELLIGGAGVARGYLERPGLTAERFVPDPFGGEPGGRLYRTGDRARWRADGTLEFMGRTDQQVKVRGFRIEPGEVEAALLACGGVRECVVVARPDDRGEARLVGYVAGEADADTLREHLRRTLPAYMVPAALVVLPALPVTPNGKLDRGALPEPDLASGADRYAAPRTALEQVLAEIWAGVLRVDRVGRHDNFFALGGHSLLAVALVERMRSRGLHADVRALFAAPTVAGLAATVGSGAREVEVPANAIPPGCGAITPEMLPLVELAQAEIDRIVAGVPGGAANVQDVYPLAPLQEGILFHHLLEREGDPYLLPLLLFFRSRERLDACLRAVQAVIGRHDVLRTAVHWEGLSEPVQVVWREAPLPVEEVEADAGGGDAARRLYDRFDPRRHRIDVRRAPLARGYVTRDPVRGRWVLLLLLHHLTSDHTTLEALREEVRAHLLGRAERLPAVLPFRSFVAQARLGVPRAEHEAFFRGMLGDVDEPTAPFGLLDARGDGSGVEQARLPVEEGLGARLRARARALGVSPASVCHVAWAQVLARVSERRDVVFGTVLFGRMQGGAGADRVLGPFINTLPVRVRVEEGAEAAVRRTQALLSELIRHEHAPLALAQSCSGVRAPEPLFSSFLNYRHNAAGGRRRPVRGPGHAAYAQERSNYPLSFSVDDLGDGFFLTAQVEADVGPERVCALVHTALEGLLEALEAAPETPVHHIEVLPEAERRRVLHAWNPAEAADPAERCVHRLFEEQAGRAPGAVAVVHEGERLTYGELNARANRLAHHLRERGVGPDARVALCAERGPHLVVGMLAVLKAGGAYVPLDPAYPGERLRFMLADSGPVAVLTQGSPAGLLAGLAPGLPVLDLAAPAWADRPDGDPDGVGLAPERLAYVIYTSGSTGAPKGVCVQHRSLAATLLAARDAFGLGPADRAASLASFAFDIWIFETLLPLLAGSSVQSFPRERVPELPGLVRDLASCTVLHAVPALMRGIVGEVRATPDGALRGMRRVFVGGEAVAPDLLDEMRAAFPAAEVHVLYGPTEASIICAAHRPGGGPARRRMVGRPLGNAALYVLDPEGRPVPAGAPGELCIAGAAVARGYLGRPELTAERFVPDPFRSGPGARAYRSGDRARWLAGGELEFLGRVDQQVKVRGFRIEPGEIEARLREHPAVREAVVAAPEGAAGAARLVAYYVGAETPPEALRRHLAERLPEYMVPAAYVRLDAVPLTPTGKLDRRALPAPGGDGHEAHAHAAPAGEVEELLAAVWADVLEVERVGRGAHFFELGGHSLLAARVVSRLREVFSVELPLRALFEAPTLAELAGRVEALRRAGLPVLPPVAPVERSGPLPLSFAQERLWFLDRLQPGGSAYNVPAALRLEGRLDARALERALGEVVRRHEALRTTFREREGSPVQVVAPFAGLALPVQDLAALEPARREAEAARQVREEAVRPFDLAAGPLLRARLLRLGGEAHVLLLSMHHVVSDGWSMGVLFRELSALYTAYRAGRVSPLGEPAVQYADYAAWQRAVLRGEVLERQLAYWRARLAGMPALLELPGDRVRPAVQTFRGAHERLELGGELVGRLRGLGRGEGATLFMTLLGAFQVLLSRYAGVEDVVVGSPVAGRSRGEVEELIGFFVNTLVLRTDVSGDPSFREVLGRVREVTLGAYEHQEVPFERLVQELAPERSLSHSPLFQVMFALDGAGRPGVLLPGLGSSPLGAETGSAKADLLLDLAGDGEGLRGALTYATDLFERSTMRRMLRHLERVLEQVARDPGLRLSGLELVDEGERRRVVEEWNRTARPYPRGACIHELFEARAAARPDAPALAWGGEELTYRELDARANRLAHHLAGLGVGPESRVGVLLERGVELIVSVLAVLKAGGCYVPLDPGYPAERLRMMLEDSGVRVLLARGGAGFSADAAGPAVVLLDRAADALAREPAAAPRSGATAENLAYIVYTSGSTGKPKGVMVAHRHVVQLAVDTDYVRLGPGDRVAQASNASFDALTFEAWGALMNGATLVGIPRDVLLAPAAFRQALREERITTLYQTTALLNQLSREQPDIFAPLREVLFGGQAVDADSVRRLIAAGRPKRLLHMYGPTETTAWCSCEDVELVEEDAPTVSVGRPTGNQRIYVLDAALNPVPAGVPGEAYVGGDGVVRGYLDRPALTAERFLPDPFAAEPGARMYRTGDRLRWKQDGRLEFVGRIDAQVKVRGFRIEPGEIESVLSAHPEVREARVVVREDEPGEQRLVAYLVGGADADGVREHLRRVLPEYMVPSAFVVLDALPLTPQGKLDVGALPAPDLASAADRYVAPRTPTEEVVAGTWAEVLHLERVGAADDFFELGGHSLLAARVVSRLREVFSVELPLRALFEAPVLAELAGRVEALRRAGLPVLPPVAPVERSGPLPLSFAQERLWFLDRLQPGGSAYNVPAALRLEGRLDARALERALGEVVRRHEALRTTFREREGSPVQVVAPFAGLALPVQDLAALEPARREAEAARQVREEAVRPFDLAAGPLLRARLLRLGGEAHVLLLSMHHVVSDGWSMGVLFRELSALYAAYRAGRASPLGEPAVQYADYAAWQRSVLRGGVLERQLAYWRDRLAGMPALLELPGDRVRPAVQTFRGAHERLELGGELVGRLRGLGRGEGATLFMTLLGAFQVLLSRYAGVEDVVVGSPVAGRARGEVEDLIGFFVNTLVLRTDVSGDPSFREVLGRVREVTLGAYEHQEVPFERLVQELAPERSLSHSPLFQVAFALDEAAGPALDLPGLGVRAAEAELGTTKFDLALFLAAGPAGVRGVLTYGTDLFERSTIQRMLAHLRNGLEWMAGHPDARLSLMDVLGAEERRRVVEEWSGTDGPYHPRPVHHLVAEQAARAPGAAALSSGGRTITYREMDAAANRLAHLLAARGAGPEWIVGVVAERTPETALAMLAVLKAGAAYLPLDPAYPGDRLRYMLADSGARLLVAPGGLPAALEGAELPPVVDPRAEAHAAAAYPDAAPRAASDPDQLAYVIYTSGSTGRPKGVAVTHRGVRDLAAWKHGRVGQGAGDRVLQFASFSFDAAVEELLTSLLTGATLVMAPREALLPGEPLRDTMRRERVTVALLPPSVLAVLDPAELPDLRVVVSGGEALTPAVVARWAGAVQLHNAYGPTETTVVATSCRVAAGPGETSIGRPLARSRAYVLDAGGLPVPVGVPGELHVGGVGTARGYLGRPDLTAERFVPDPFGREAGGRLYRTGDRVRWRAEGTLEYLGRTDHQVKLRGFRIELGEIEAALRRHPGVSDCAVVVREDAPGEKRLAAYVVGAADADELRAHLRRSLPEHMVPGAFAGLGALPLTPNGKLDRRALPAPASAAAEGGRHLRPSTELEARIAAVWQALLGVEEVGVEDNFFDLGGHSLLLTRMQTRLAADLGHRVPVVDLFQYPTVRSLAARLQGNGETGAVEEGGDRGGTRQAMVGRRLEARRRREG